MPQWKSPEEGKTKINVDAFLAEMGVRSVGLVINDDQCRVILFAMLLKKQKLWVLVDLLLGQNWVYSEFTVETGCAQLVSEIYKTERIM
jgi:hypothetical protein